MHVGNLISKAVERVASPRLGGSPACQNIGVSEVNVKHRCSAVSKTAVVLVLATFNAATLAAQDVELQSEEVDAVEHELPPPPPVANGDQPQAPQSILESSVAQPTTSGTPAPSATGAEDDRNSDELLASTDQGYDLMLRGPVHEAFAMRTEVDAPAEVIIAPQAPPQPIAEQPPENRPSGNNVQWINGYWAWSNEVDDYVWVSGLYRDVPPDRQWIDGYWSRAENGYQWTHGYWASTGTDAQIAYLPEPPESIDNGPSTPPPTADSFWLPGHWNYVDNQYRWQSGYWTQHHPGWVWQPACYIHSPQGYLFVDGYWDYEPIYRGQLYAPVFFRTPLYTQSQYRYRPAYPLARAASLLLHLFVRPGYRYYYYGDYYDPRFANYGYQPWYRYNTRGYAGSPWLGYYDWRYRNQGISFYDSMLRYDNYFRTTPQARSSILLTAATQQAISLGLSSNLRVNSLDDLVRNVVAGQPPQRVQAGTGINQEFGVRGGQPGLGSAVDQLRDRVGVGDTRLRDGQGGNFDGTIRSRIPIPDGSDVFRDGSQPSRGRGSNAIPNRNNVPDVFRGDSPSSRGRGSNLVPNLPDVPNVFRGEPQSSRGRGNNAIPNLNNVPNVFRGDSPSSRGRGSNAVPNLNNAPNFFRGDAPSSRGRGSNAIPNLNNVPDAFRGGNRGFRGNPGGIIRGGGRGNGGNGSPGGLFNGGGIPRGRR